MNQTKWAEMTALHIASSKGHLNIVKTLVAKGAHQNQIDDEGMTPLHHAAKADHTLVAEFLTFRGADINKQQDDVNKTALHLAVDNDNLRLVKFLLSEGADPNFQDAAKLSPLHTASEKGFEDIARELLRHGARVNWKKDPSPALQLTVEKNHLTIVEMLLEHKAHVDRRDKQKNTALHIAVKHGHFDIAQLLADNQASVNKPDKDGLTALHLAMRHRNKDLAFKLADLLLSMEAIVKLKDRSGFIFEQESLHSDFLVWRPWQYTPMPGMLLVD